ncbi:MAG: hypothetical protein LBL46_02130 [Rickettsiales bacterium]|jgi:hypothetical protein|nr:hypothetical protein [Rickettsiales bacterium]
MIKIMAAALAVLAASSARADDLQDRARRALENNRGIAADCEAIYAKCQSLQAALGKNYCAGDARDICSARSSSYSISYLKTLQSLVSNMEAEIDKQNGDKISRGMSAGFSELYNMAVATRNNMALSELVVMLAGNPLVNGTPEMAELVADFEKTGIASDYKLRRIVAAAYDFEGGTMCAGAGRTNRGEFGLYEWNVPGCPRIAFNWYYRLAPEEWRYDCFSERFGGGFWNQVESEFPGRVNENPDARMAAFKKVFRAWWPDCRIDFASGEYSWEKGWSLPAIGADSCKAAVALVITEARAKNPKFDETQFQMCLEKKPRD